MRYLIAFLSLLSLANAQFGGFFDQMFNNGGREHRTEPQNNPSDASLYQNNYDNCASFPNRLKS